jgi:hypothetical protein
MARGDKTGGRTRKLTRGQKKKVFKRKVKRRAKLPNSFKLTWQVFKIFRQHWKPLGGIVIVYLLLNVVFASGISGLSASVDSIKANLQDGGQFSNAISGFSSLVGSGGTGGSQTASVLQGVLVVLESLVIIWALRHLLAGKRIAVKQAYYQSMGPLIPFMLVVLVVFIQLLPLTIGWPIFGAILGVIFNPGAALTILSLIIFALLAAWSFYMISSSIFALYIVTLPDMQPRPALRSAKDLVKFRRWQLMRKVLFLPIFILVLMAVLVIPLILFASSLVAPVFYILSMLAILFIHTYLYSLYRSLLE